MSKILIILFIAIIAGFAINALSGQPPLRGMTHASASPMPVLLSRARPALTFDFGKDLPLLASGWCTVRPATHESEPGSARVWLALYGHDKGLVATAVCDGENRWEWLSGDHTAYPVIRTMHQDMGKRTLFENLMVLDRKHDPFCAGKSDGVCLVYRARLLQEFDITECIVEYHEDLPDSLVQDIAFANDYLNDFQKRARNTVRIRLLDETEAAGLARNMKKMGTLDKGISRLSLARWTGMMHKRGRF